jgi:hypothetical protein
VLAVDTSSNPGSLILTAFHPLDGVEMRDHVESGRARDVYLWRSHILLADLGLDRLEAPRDWPNGRLPSPEIETDGEFVNFLRKALCQLNVGPSEVSNVVEKFFHEVALAQRMK